MKKVDREIRNKKIIELSETKSQVQLAEIFSMTQCGIGRILRINNIHRKKSRLFLSSVNTEYFNKINTHEKAYWLGYICADGNVKFNKISLISKDLEIINRFKSALSSKHKITENNIFDKRTNKIYKSYSIQICSEILAKNLISHGVTENKSKILLFPKIPIKFYSYFIAGLFDGDGYVGLRANNKLRMSLISTKEVLNFIQIYLNKKFKILPTKLIKVSENVENVWKMHLYRDTNLFLKFIYSDKNFKYLNRKYKIYIKNV